ncbi:MAG: DUF1156 domain-containing protein, partial [SAR324 cluster bacterium]|nr:DUF1156 domain-containing protein [SAR324 cluster bacterium]
MTTYRKKLIEVSLPLEAINLACQSEKYNPFLKNHPRAIHHWWARRPLAACRAVIWASLVDDPSEYIESEELANQERERLFSILEKLVQWENSNNEEVIENAKVEIARSISRDLNCEMPVGKEAIREFLIKNAPPVLDAFAGGGSIPLEAQRLGLKAYGNDLNPVAVLMNKALIEIPPSFSDKPPIHSPEIGNHQASFLKKDWKGAAGLADDIRFYGKWLCDEASKRIGYLYPSIKIDSDLVNHRPDLITQGYRIGEELNVVAWLWTRTVKCPNPACEIEMPLVRSFKLSNKSGKQIWIEPKIEGTSVRFEINLGNGTVPTGTVNRNGARCLACGAPVPFDYIRQEGTAGRIDIRLMAIVAEGKKGRIYFPPNSLHETTAKSSVPSWKPDTKLPEKALGFRVQAYGMKTHSSLFLDRQLVLLATLTDICKEVEGKVVSDANNEDNNIRSNPKQENMHTIEPEFLARYAKAIRIYLSLAISQLTRYSNTICIWNTTNQNVVQSFSRQAIPMTWDFAETNPLVGQLTIQTTTTWIAAAIQNLGWSGAFGFAELRDSTISFSNMDQNPIVVTDPPYFDNIGYADLSDFFYVWLRYSLSDVFPDLFSTLLTPKAQELIASPFRHEGSRVMAEKSFLEGLNKSFRIVSDNANKKYPFSVFYAYKQSEEEEVEGSEDSETLVSSTGWGTMLEGLLTAGFSIVGTWPMHTERPTGVKIATNSLASSIVLVCRSRDESATAITRREFISNLKRELPLSLRQLQKGNIAPVDLAQAAIGPGMAIFSRHSSVMEADGSIMTVRIALALINQVLDEYLAEQEGEYDNHTRWALAWYEQYGNEQGPYGVAETLSKAKNTSVKGLSHAGFLEARTGNVRLLKRDELE